MFLKLKKVDEQLERVIRLYGGAREQAGSASGKNKEIYESKARDHLRDLTKWLREHMQSGYRRSVLRHRAIKLSADYRAGMGYKRPFSTFVGSEASNPE